MKFFEPTEKRNTVAAYTFLVALFCVICITIGVNIKIFPKLFSYLYEIAKPIIYGFIIAFLLHPIVRVIETKVLGNRKEKKAGFRRFLSVVITYVIVLALIFLFCVTAIPEIVNNYSLFEQGFWNYIDTFRNNAVEVVNSLSGSESIYLYTDIPEGLRDDVTDDLFSVTLRDFDGTVYTARSTSLILQVRDIFDDTLTTIGNMISASFPTLFNSVGMVVTEAKNLIIGIFISLYFLLGERKHIKRIDYVFKAWLPKKAYTRIVWLVKKAKNIFRDYIIVRLIDGVIVGALMYICLFIFQVDYRIFLSVLMGVASFFPFIGPIIGIAAGTFLLLFVDFKYALIFLIISVVVKLFDSRYVETVLNEGRDEYTLPAFWVFTAIVVMSGFFGVVGVLIGIPLFAFIYSVVKELCEKRLAKAGLAVDTLDYFAVEKAKGKKVEDKEPNDALDMRTYYDERREIDQENADTAKQAISKVANFFKKHKEKRIEKKAKRAEKKAAKKKDKNK